ncbi:MAG TPA: discoidin domain-containing protein, partial [Bacillota bacterium]|nr:discoidin domain-containing protein [Bacillota bacterium]
MQTKKMQILMCFVIMGILLGVFTIPLATAATNLAQGKAASADSSQSANPAANGNDGNTGTRWCAANGNTGHWWMVDLGSSQSITGTEVMWEKSGVVYKYKVETSTDNVNWTLKVDKNANTSTAQTQTDNFTGTARYVRITVTGLSTSPVAWASFFEFRVFGAGGTTTPTPTGRSSTPTPSTATTPTPTMVSTDGPPVDPALRSQCTGTSPIKFHMNVAPGNYDVTVVLGDTSSAGATLVQAEARRLMFGQLSTSAGTLSRQTFTVNVREPEGQPTGQGGTGTSGLDLVFAGSNPKLNGLGVVTASNPLVVYLCGDSTTCDQPTAPYTGWGQMLPHYCKLGLCIANYGDSGESSGSFLSNSALFPAVEKLIKANNYVFIQFGHNDKSVDEATYKTNLTSYVTKTRAKGGIPIFITPPVRRLFNSDGKTLSSTALHVNSLGVNLPAAMKAVATANNVPLIDLTTKSKNLVESLGQSGSTQLYLTAAKDGVDDNTHFCEYGANEMAKLVLQGIR